MVFPPARSTAFSSVAEIDLLNARVFVEVGDVTVWPVAVHAVVAMVYVVTVEVILARVVVTMGSTSVNKVHLTIG